MWLPLGVVWGSVVGVVWCLVGLWVPVVGVLVCVVLVGVFGRGEGRVLGVGRGVGGVADWGGEVRRWRVWCTWAGSMTLPRPLVKLRRQTQRMLFDCSSPKVQCYTF